VSPMIMAAPQNAAGGAKAQRLAAAGTRPPARREADCP
jgi:hypothetical protein